MQVKRLREDELYHHGIKGQRWGIRRYQNPDGSLTPAGMRHYGRQAKKDAKEYARAKMFYGEGAGNRRKLIKAKVEERSKNEYYKQEFERHLGEQDMGAHAEKAQAERHRKDVQKSAAKTARGIKNIYFDKSVGLGAAAIATTLTAASVAYKTNPQFRMKVDSTVRKFKNKVVH